MWIKEAWNEIDADQPQQRTVTITLEEYRELIMESTGHGDALRKKDEIIEELNFKVQSLTNAIPNGIVDDGE